WSHRNSVQSNYSSLEDITYKSGKMQHYGKKDLLAAYGEKSLP
ncbi:unnamed protein product, partial [Rotaria sp. Silwood1]